MDRLNEYASPGPCAVKRQEVATKQVVRGKHILKILAVYEYLFM